MTKLDMHNERPVRLEKLKKIQEAGTVPYPEKFDKKNDLADALKQKEGTAVQVAGRIMSIRDMGKIAFCHLQDFSGRMQVVLNAREIDKEDYKFFIKHFDIGDFIGITGEIFTTKKGEVSVMIKKYTFLGKALRPMPEKWHGLKDAEAKYRQRYLDLIMNQETKDKFIFRSNFIRAIREFYWQKGFYEVETPTLLHQATGATATPYSTHNNALDIDLYLRIAHELPLKELIVGGYEKIFELGKAFRNEGADPSHLPEHTHLEHYCAYWNYEDNITFTEELFDYIFKTLKLNKKMPVLGKDGQSKTVDFTTPWPRVNFIEMIKKDSAIDITKYDKASELLKEIKKQKIQFEGMDQMSLTGLVDNLYKKVSRPKIVNPTILYNYPKYMQPLARASDDNDQMVDQFQLIVNGWELLKAYSELVDPIDQKARFDEQKQAKSEGEEEIQETDDDFIVALEHGSPPISGWGMGIDRTVAILTGSPNLRDVVLFPMLRPENSEQSSPTGELDKKNK